VNTINYFQSVVARLGRRQAKTFLRLYMTPGMQHCSGGPGPDSFGATVTSAQSDPRRDLTLALERWVESGVAPEQIIATKRQSADPKSPVIRTRPLCAYPQVARYKGSGNTDDVANFVCTAESDGSSPKKATLILPSTDVPHLRQVCCYNHVGDWLRQGRRAKPGDA